jgi:hypothetical protein
MTPHHFLLHYSKRYALAAATSIPPANNGMTVGSGPIPIAPPLLVEEVPPLLVEEVACAGVLESFTPLPLPLIIVTEPPLSWPLPVMTVSGALAVELGLSCRL